MTGGSDYLPFLEAGIPSGGMATGASLPKTSLERTIFGGFANAAYDPCYHLSCDTIENISQEGITQVFFFFSLFKIIFFLLRYIVRCCRCLHASKVCVPIRYQGVFGRPRCQERVVKECMYLEKKNFFLSQSNG